MFERTGLLVGFAGKPHAGNLALAQPPFEPTVSPTASQLLHHFSTPPVYLGCACMMTPLFLEESSQFFFTSEGIAYYHRHGHCFFQNLETAIPGQINE